MMEEGELNPATSGGDELYNALHQRLVASGEWQRLLILLRRMLDECGWETQFQQTATQKAKQQPVLSVPDLIDQLTPAAKGKLDFSPRRYRCEGRGEERQRQGMLTRSYTFPFPFCEYRYTPTTRQSASFGEAEGLPGSKPRRCLNGTRNAHKTGSDMQQDESTLACNEAIIYPLLPPVPTCTTQPHNAKNVPISTQ